MLLNIDKGNKMNYYAFNQEGIFTGIVRGQKNPRGSGFLQPANSTTITPIDTNEYEDAYFDIPLQQWSLVPNEKAIEKKLEERDENGILLFEKTENGFFKERSQEVKELELKERIKADLYSNMVEDIYNNMFNVFGTRNDVSAAAFASTWEAMLSRPANYVDSELGFNSEAEVTAYAQAKLNAADAYGIFRLKRIAQYEAEKAAL